MLMIITIWVWEGELATTIFGVLVMGCATSKVEDLPLVVFCRERKELLRAAADHRFTLAAAHVAYFDSLRVIGNTLHRYVADEMCTFQPPSPVLTLPPPSHAAKLKPFSSSTSLSHHSDDSHLHFHSDHSDVDADSARPSSVSSPPPATHYHYMRSTSAIPTMVPEQPQQDPYQAYMMGGGYGPIGSPLGDPYFGYSQPQRSTATPPPPPPPDVSPWDFLNLFNAVESLYPGYGYPAGKYGIGSSASSPDSAQVREREGIPDLEDETAEEEVAKDASNDKLKKTKQDLDGGSGEGTSKKAAAAASDGHLELSSEKGSRSTFSGDGGGGSKGSLVEEVVSKKGVSFDGVESSRLSNFTAASNHRTNDDGIESSRPSSLTTISPHGVRHIQEVVKEIKEEFETASSYGREVSSLLEVGKLRYRPKNPLSEAFSCRWFLDAIEPPKLISSRNSSKRLKYSAAYATANSRDRDLVTNSLSSTLEKLYAWEKKLYKEVKDEEKLRVIYEKKCKLLKYLDDRGAESNKIDATQASIKKLLSKMSVTIKAIDTISSRIHKLRDEELRPQVIELLQGFIRMWKNMVKCHQKQFQCILETKNQYLTGKTGIRRDSRMQAAKDLEQELLKWYSCFNNWISSQKMYVNTLNGWLLKSLLQEPEVTADGIAPFSPSRVGAPPVFIICNDWYQAMERISDIEVLRAMQSFAVRLHMLWELQDEVRRQKLKAEYLSRDFERTLKSLRQEAVLQMNGDASDKKSVILSSKDSIILPDDERRAALDSMKKRLDEEHLKHEEAIKHVSEEASISLETGLLPIFEAITNFSSETLKIHEEIRIQGPGGT